MKTKIYITTFLLVFTLISCKKENTLSEYKYADKPMVLPCDNLNSKLYNEALYSFEDDILNFYGKDKKNLLSSYSQFLRFAIYGRVKYQDIVSEHTLKVFDALKNDTDLWDLNSAKSHLNYSSKLMDCISKNIKNKDLKTTLNALLTTNSMSPELYGAPVLASYSLALNDKALASYVAFDMYYAKLFDVDLTQVGKEKPKVDFNATK
jgi:hypothetical protein